jgi:hypothetical protein
VFFGALRDFDIKFWLLLQLYGIHTSIRIVTTASSEAHVASGARPFSFLGRIKVDMACRIYFFASPWLLNTSWLGFDH